MRTVLITKPSYLLKGGLAFLLEGKGIEMKKFFCRILLALAVCAAMGLFVSGAALAYYVDRDISISGNGANWSEAFKTIQEAIDAANAGDAIWVKQGTYFVGPTINIDKNVSIYGGFDGTETRTVRAKLANKCHHCRWSKCGNML